MWRNVSIWHVLVIVIALVLIFGWKRLPDMSRSVGQSLRIFKSEVEQLSDKDKDKDSPSAASSDTVRGSAEPRPSATETDPDDTARPEESDRAHRHDGPGPRA